MESSLSRPTASNPRLCRFINKTRFLICWMTMAKAMAIVVATSLPSRGQTPNQDRFNYAEALQKTLYFLEAQQSGHLSPNNRVAWRGDAFLDDGQDIGKDLSGGWFDAGDHWTANLTMSFLAMTLAWSAIEKPDGWRDSEQLDELLESLVHVNQYFLKCVLNPECDDPSLQLEICIGCGGREGVEPPNVHAMWGPAEVAHWMTNRPTFRLNHQHPGSDIPSAMACAMVASAMVIRDHGDLLKSKRGFNDFDTQAFSEKLIDHASKLIQFSLAHMGRALTNERSEEEKQSIQRERNLALRSDGKAVEVGYRAGGIDKTFTAATWMARAATSQTEREKWLAVAESIYEGPYKSEDNHGFWKDYSAGNFGKLGAYNMVRIDPSMEKYHHELQAYCHGFLTYYKTPGGLRLREKHAHEYGSLRHSNNAAVMALYYSDWVTTSPPLIGNTWWKGEKTNAELKSAFREAAAESVNYALGANPYGRSYLVGFGNAPFNHPHHRGAYGAWAGFDHFIPGKADDRANCRHILYGALIAGPDYNDVFLCGNERHPWLKRGDSNDFGFFYKFPNRKELIPKDEYVWDSSDTPVQDVMDSVFNEVALDYNAGFMASLAWMCSEGLGNSGPMSDLAFPPADARNESVHPTTTDREFFVLARKVGDSTTESQLELSFHNHSRWPSKTVETPTLRCYLELDPGDSIEDVVITILGETPFVHTKLLPTTGRGAVLDITLENQRVFPGSSRENHRTVVLQVHSPHWDPCNDWSWKDLGDELQMNDRVTVMQGGKTLTGTPPEN